MSRPNPRPRLLHGLADYNYIALVSMAPELFGFEEEEKATLLCHLMASAVLVTTFFTRTEWGFARIIPYKIHLLLDFLSGVGALGAPYLLGFSENRRARNTFLVMGLAGVFASLFTRDAEME